MEVFRLSRAPYAHSLSGKGAAIKGARWNSVGLELIYTAQNRSLAMAEVAVHFSLATLPDDYMMVSISIPDHIEIGLIHEDELPSDWNAFPHPTTTQRIGDEFVFQNRYCAIMVPSAVTKGDYNILINPNHREFGSIEILKVEKFPFVKRIFR
ncbi:RES family NAD+ phosphorylase [Aquiflexum sp.]|uniref:RES family NAD+ phosphorylase n=1 Tax=Aquiflexum sp. TaxID=1872584 RepID=UPI003593C29F